MLDLDVLREILERHGGRKVDRSDLGTVCDVYELDPTQCDKYECMRQIEEAGFEYADSWVGDYFKKLAGEEPLVKKTEEIRKKSKTLDGATNRRYVEEADRAVLDVMLSGQIVSYGSVDELVRVQSLMKPGMVLVPLDTEYMLNEARIRNYIREGSAIILTNPHFPRCYGILMEKPLPDVGADSN